jgi:hypothetical protein
MVDVILEPSDILAMRGTPSERFIRLSEKADQRLSELLGDPDTDEDSLKYQYMTQLEAIADALNITGLSPSDTMPISDNRWKQFKASVHTARTNAALAAYQAQSGADEFVALSTSAEARIRDAIGRLRELINASDVGGKKKARLLRRLADLEREVNEERLSISKALQTMAIIATIFGGTATGLAKAPEAIETIYDVVQLLGQEQETRENLMLPPPPKMLPPPEEDDSQDKEKA